MADYQLLLGDCLEVLSTMESESVQTCVTSPPYFGLRDYGTAKWEGGDPKCDHNPQRPDGGERADRVLPLGRGGLYRDTCGKCGAVRVDNQVGLEKTPEEYVDRLVGIFREVRRVLRDDGTTWLNLGDSYSGSCGNGTTPQTNINLTAEKFTKYRNVTARVTGLKPKDLIGIPWRVAFALQADGWYLRSDIIWHKPNPMPESVKDRPTKSHEYIFLLSKSPRYYYDSDAVREPLAEASVKRDKTPRGRRQKGGGSLESMTGIDYTTELGDMKCNPMGRNRRSVWSVNTRPFKGAHFAVFPPTLIEPCILAGSREGDLVLDPFNGSGTTGTVALKHKRRYVGIELNPDYIELSKKRIESCVTTGT